MKRLRQTVLDVAGYLVVMTPLLIATLLVVWMSQIGNR